MASRRRPRRDQLEGRPPRSVKARAQTSFSFRLAFFGPTQPTSFRRHSRVTGANVNARRSRLSLRGRLIALVIATLPPLLALSLLNTSLHYRTRQDDISRETLQVARSLAQAVEADHRARLAGLQALALSPFLQSGDLVALRTQADAFLSTQPVGATLGLADQTGQLLFAAGAVPSSGPLPTLRKHGCARGGLPDGQASRFEPFHERAHRNAQLHLGRARSARRRRHLRPGHRPHAGQYRRADRADASSTGLDCGDHRRSGRDRRAPARSGTLRGTTRLAVPAPDAVEGAGRG